MAKRRRNNAKPVFLNEDIASTNTVLCLVMALGSPQRSVFHAARAGLRRLGLGNFVDTEVVQFIRRSEAARKSARLTASVN